MNPTYAFAFSFGLALYGFMYVGFWLGEMVGTHLRTYLSRRSFEAELKKIDPRLTIEDVYYEERKRLEVEIIQFINKHRQDDTTRGH